MRCLEDTKNPLDARAFLEDIINEVVDSPKIKHRPIF